MQPVRTSEDFWSQNRISMTWTSRSPKRLPISMLHLARLLSSLKLRTTIQNFFRGSLFMQKWLRRSSRTDPESALKIFDRPGPLLRRLLQSIRDVVGFHGSIEVDGRPRGRIESQAADSAI